jgi:hypothetical protein
VRHHTVPNARSIAARAPHLGSSGEPWAGSRAPDSALADRDPPTL